MIDDTDFKIAKMIDDYIGKARATGEPEGVDLITKAFRLLQKDRRAQCLADEISSSAEHYLTARDFSADLVILGHAASLAYDGAKLIPGMPWVLKHLLGNECPITEVTTRQTYWKLKGNDSGTVDAILRNRRIKSVVVELVEEQKSEALQKAQETARNLHP